MQRRAGRQLRHGCCGRCRCWRGRRSLNRRLDIRSRSLTNRERRRHMRLRNRRLHCGRSRRHARQRRTNGRGLHARSFLRGGLVCGCRSRVSSRCRVANFNHGRSGGPNWLGCRAHLDFWCKCGGWNCILQGSFRIRLGWSGLRHPGSVIVRERLPGIVAVVMALHQLRDVFVNRTGMCLLLGYAEFRQQIDDLMRGHLQLPSQLVDADFTHSNDCDSQS